MIAMLADWHQPKQAEETAIYISIFPCGSAGREATCNAGDLGLIPGLGRSLEEGKGYPLQYSGMENSWGRKDKINRKIVDIQSLK